MFRNLTLKQIAAVLATLLVLLGAILVSGTVFIGRTMGDIQDTWMSFQVERSDKARLEASLRAVLGYGGMIHHFKNYVLRHEPSRRHAVEENLGAARSILDQYATLGVSSAESVALQDIEEMLGAYGEALWVASTAIAERRTAAEIDAQARVDDTRALRGLENLRSEILGHWAEQSGRFGKATLVSRLRAALGYGGMVHAFKNFVLRGGTHYLERAREQLQAARGVIAEYVGGAPGRAEVAALEDIERVLDAYAEAIDAAERMKTEGAISEAIDAKIKVDDSLALRGLRVLDQEIAAQVQAIAAEMNTALSQVEQAKSLMVWSIVALIGFLVAFSLWLVLGHIVVPIRRMAGAMTDIAAGDLGFEVRGTGRPNEIGDMARALSVFRDVALSRQEAEENLARSNEELSMQLLALQDVKERSEEQAAQAVGLAESLAVAREKAEEAVGRAEADEQRIRSILDTVTDAVITIDDKGIIETFNSAAQAIFGYKEAEVVGRNVSMLMPEPTCSNHDGYLARFHDGEAARIVGATVEQVALHKDGREFPIDLSVNPMRLGGTLKFTGVIRDITERKKAEEEIRRLALTDPLTGLANRNQFNGKFEDALKLARRQDQLAALMVLDLDKFKPVNDTYGHPVGDALLQMVAGKVLDICREIDTVARLGGDEFAVILVEPEDREGVIHAAERIVEALCTPMTVLGHKVQIGTSIGIAFFPDDGEDDETLFRRADLALYEAKEAGRNCWRAFEPRMEAPTEAAD